MILKKRATQLAKRQAEQQRINEEAQRALALQIQVENQQLLDSADLFLQLHNGNVIGVEDIFTGLMGGEPHHVTDTDPQGDTLLTISASLGNADLCRKCILWGFDINHRNHDDHNAIMVAAKENRLAAFQYLLSFYQAAVDTAAGGDDEDGEGGSDKQTLVLSEEDKGLSC
jgi:hypothetical protein